MSTQDLARSLNLLPLPQLASYFTAIYGYKILKLMTPEYVYNQFLNQSHRFPIRDVSILKAPNNNNFLNSIAITFNNLPENIRSQTKFSSFKNLSFKHFMSHAWPYFRHLTENSFAVSHLIQLPSLNICCFTPFLFHPFLYQFIIFLSHHGKHSKEWCCLTIKVL